MNVIQHRGKAAELTLVEAGYSLAEIRGSREVHTEEQPPTGVRAAVNRLSPRTAHAAMAGTLGLGLLAAAETALLSPLALAALVAAGLYLLGRVEFHPHEVEREVQRPGMSHQEVLDRLIQYDEVEQARKEKAQEDAPSTPSAGQASQGRRY